MPKSRVRRSTAKSTSSRQRKLARHDEARAVRTGTVKHALSRMSSQHWASVRACADAELRADASGALEHYERVPMFDGSLHHKRLQTLSDLGPAAPAWLWSRWMTIQARRPVWSGCGDGPDPALDLTLDRVYPYGVDPSRMDDFAPEAFAMTIHERDWVHRQLTVYELGGLDEVVRRGSDRLLSGADQPDSWARAPMRGLRLESGGGEHARLVDLATRDVVEVLDLGIKESYPGEHVIGRLVPTTTAPGVMFEWMPLSVDETTAGMVAEQPGKWLDTLAERARSRALPVMFSYLDDDTSMTADLPVRCWMALLEEEDIGQLPLVRGLIDYDDIAMFVLDKIMRIAQATVPLLGHARHYAEMLLLEPGLADRIGDRYGGPRHAVAWAALAGVVREPARSRCRDFAVYRRQGEGA